MKKNILKMFVFLLVFTFILAGCDNSAMGGPRAIVDPDTVDTAPIVPDGEDEVIGGESEGDEAVCDDCGKTAEDCDCCEECGKTAEDCDCCDCGPTCSCGDKGVTDGKCTCCGKKHVCSDGDCRCGKCNHGTKNCGCKTCDNNCTHCKCGPTCSCGDKGVTDGKCDCCGGNHECSYDNDGNCKCGKHQHNYSNGKCKCGNCKHGETCTCEDKNNDGKCDCCGGVVSVVVTDKEPPVVDKDNDDLTNMDDVEDALNKGKEIVFSDGGKDGISWNNGNANRTFYLPSGEPVFKVTSVNASGKVKGLDIEIYIPNVNVQIVLKGSNQKNDPIVGKTGSFKVESNVVHTFVISKAQ